MKPMQKILTTATLIALTTILNAQSIKLAWDASPSATNEATGYRLYCATNAFNEATKTNALVRLDVGTNLTATITNIVPATWFFRATAYSISNRLESVLSEPLIVTVPTYPPENLRLYVLEASTVLVGTNWQDVGLFRVRIEKP